MHFKLKRLKRELVYRGGLLKFYRDTVRLPDGKEEQWDFVAHPTGGACVVPVLPDGRILMERQYRPAIEAETLELPAGARRDAEEDTRVTARRELEEETGFSCCDADLQFLARLKTAPSWCSESTDVYLAENLKRLPARHLDEAEEIGLEAFRLADLLPMIRTGALQDAKTVAGILAYAELLNERRQNPES